MKPPIKDSLEEDTKDNLKHVHSTSKRGQPLYKKAGSHYQRLGLIITGWVSLSQAGSHYHRLGLIITASNQHALHSF